jgi:hypothetical protein
MHASFIANFCVQFQFLAGSSETVQSKNSSCRAASHQARLQCRPAKSISTYRTTMYSFPLHSDYKYSLRSQKALRSVAVATRLLGWLHFFSYFPSSRSEIVIKSAFVFRVFPRHFFADLERTGSLAKLGAVHLMCTTLCTKKTQSFPSIVYYVDSVTHMRK